MSSSTIILRSKILGAPPSRFERVVMEALPLWREMTVASPDAHHASVPRNRKLTAAAFMREACKNGNTSPDRLRKLQKKLAAIGAHPTLDRYVAAVVRGCVATRTDLGNLFHAPPRGDLAQQLLSGDHQAFLNLLMEAQIAGTNVLELVALGVQIAVDTAPREVWGTADDLELERLKAEERASRWAALRKELRAAPRLDQRRTIHRAHLL